MRIDTVILTLLFSISAMAQQRSPCAEAELKAAMLDSRLAARRVEVETSRARIEALERELAKHVSESEQRLSAEQKNAANLAAEKASAQQKAIELEGRLAEKDKSIIEKDKTIITKDETIAARNVEREKALSDLKRARGWKRSFLRVIGIGKNK